MPAPSSYTIQCCFAAYSANTVTVDGATSLEEACARAIEEANASDGWKTIDHCGSTFVAAAAPGDVDGPWCRETCRSVLLVPAPYAEGGAAAVAARECVAFVERVAASMRRRNDRPGRRRARRDRADHLELLDALIAEAKAIRDRNNLPSAPGGA